MRKEGRFPKTNAMAWMRFATYRTFNPVSSSKVPTWMDEIRFSVRISLAKRFNPVNTPYLSRVILFRSNSIVLMLLAPLNPFKRRSVILLLSKYRSSSEDMSLTKEGTTFKLLPFRILRQVQPKEVRATRLRCNVKRCGKIKGQPRFQCLAI